MKGIARWHEQLGLIEVIWKAAELCEVRGNQRTGATLTRTYWQELLSLSAVKGGLYGSGIREMAVLLRSAYSETVSQEPNMLGRTKILRSISDNLSRSGWTNIGHAMLVANALKTALEADSWCIAVLDKAMYEITLRRGF